MPLKNLKVKSFGPICDANVEFGDLTLLIGPQASGKSIFLQLLKLLIDKNHIRETLESYSYSFEKNNDHDKLLDIYFGKGMSKIWKKNTEIIFNEKKIEKSFLSDTKKEQIEFNSLKKSFKELEKRREDFKESSFNKAIEDLGKRFKELENLKSTILGNNIEQLFYIPAQRVVCISDGRPKNFNEFDISNPYVLRLFSENTRNLLQNEMEHSGLIFPVPRRLKESIRNSINSSIFYDGKVIFKDDNNQKKLMLEIDDMSVPFMTWSAGQKEFMPLLMGFYYLSTQGNNPKRKGYEYIVIEEPEMGLHPRAIQTVILQVMELLSRDYKVIISTHSPVLLEFVWAFQHIKKSKVKNKIKIFQDLFKIKDSEKIFKDIEKKEFHSYFFSKEKEKTIDISSLDAGSDNEYIADWGGISEFASRAAEIVSELPNDD